MKFHIYYITRANFENSFNPNLPNLVSYNPPLYTPLIFKDDIALYAYTCDKYIAKEFERMHDMSKFIKTKSDYFLDDMISRKIELKELIFKSDGNINKITMPIVQCEDDFLNLDILVNISEEMMLIEYGISDSLFNSLNKEYCDSLNILGFHTPSVYTDNPLAYNHKLNKLGLFIKIYKGLLRK